MARFGGPGVQRAEKVATDASGNVFLVGTFENTIGFSTTDLVSAGDTDIFLAKLDRDGDVVWAKRFGGAGEDRGRSVAVDAQGNVVITGHFSQTIDLGTGPLTSQAENDIFLAKFDGAGTPLWAKQFGFSLYQTAADVACDGDGAILLTGDFVSTLNFGGDNLVSAGSSDVFLAKFDATGQHLWSRSFGDVDTQMGRGVSVDPQGNVLLLAGVEGTVDFGGGPIEGGGGGFIPLVVVKYDANASYAWSKLTVSAAHLTHSRDHSHSMDEQGHSLAGDANDAVASVAIADGTAGGGPDPEAPAAPYGVVLHLDGAGTSVGDLALGTAGGAGSQGEGAVVVGPTGHALAAGSFVGSVRLGPSSSLQSAGGRDVFFVETDRAAHIVRSFRWGDPELSEIVWSMALDPTGRITMAGWVRASDAGGTDDVLVAQFAP